MLLWIALAALTALAMAGALWPLTRSAARAPSRVGFDTAIYRAQIAEIDADAARGALAPVEADAARREVARRLLAHAPQDPPVATVADCSDPALERRHRRLLFGCLAAAPALALGLYLAVGSPSLPDQPLEARLEAPPDHQDFAVLVGKVEARLRQHPEDGDGWDVIAPVYARLERYAEASEAYRRAIGLLGESVRRLDGYAENRVLAAGGLVDESAREAFRRSLQLEPGNPRAEYWLAVGLEQQGKLAEAKAAYEKMLRDAPADAPWRDTVEKRLQVVSHPPGAGTGPAAPEAAAGASPDAAAPGPSAEDMAAAAGMSDADRSAMIEGMVERLAGKLKENPNDLSGWLRLIQAYGVMNKPEAARGALTTARQTFVSDEKALSELNALAGRLGLGS